MMSMRRVTGSICVIAILFLASCRTAARIDRTPREKITSLKFLDSASIPTGLLRRGTVVGGLSGIDYVPARNIYYMVCDDPSAFSPARFYTGQVAITGYGIDSITIVAVDSLWTPAGQLYPDIRKDRVHSADVEAMRYDPLRDELVRTSEGQRVINDSVRFLQDPGIVVMERDGRFKDSIVLPPNIHVSDKQEGMRHNMVFEGITFLKNYREFIVSIEDALYEDGNSAATGDSTAWVRFLHFDRSRKKPVAQYAYRTEAVPHVPVPPGAFKVNGVSDILAVGNDRLLVIERAWSTGRVPSEIRVFLADFRKAADISANHSLKENPPKYPISKTLLLDMGSLGFATDNIEGVTFGPDLPNGHHSLIFVADNNFSSRQHSQFLLFEVIP